MAENHTVAPGHRRAPHTADVIIEAWGPSREACLEESAHALVETFVDVRDAPATQTVPVHVDADSDEELLVTLLEEIVYVVDVLGMVPMQVRLEDTETGSVVGVFETAGVEDVEATGAIPKGVSRSELLFEERAGAWRCRALIDV